MQNNDVLGLDTIIFENDRILILNVHLTSSDIALLKKQYAFIQEIICKADKKKTIFIVGDFNSVLKLDIFTLNIFHKDNGNYITNCIFDRKCVFSGDIVEFTTSKIRMLTTQIQKILLDSKCEIDYVLFFPSCDDTFNYKNDVYLSVSVEKPTKFNFAYPSIPRTFPSDHGCLITSYLSNNDTKFTVGSLNLSGTSGLGLNWGEFIFGIPIDSNKLCDILELKEGHVIQALQKYTNNNVNDISHIIAHELLTFFSLVESEFIGQNKKELTWHDLEKFKCSTIDEVIQSKFFSTLLKFSDDNPINIHFPPTALFKDFEQYFSMDSDKYGFRSYIHLTKYKFMLNIPENEHIYFIAYFDEFTNAIIKAQETFHKQSKIVKYSIRIWLQLFSNIVNNVIISKDIETMFILFVKSRKLTHVHVLENYLRSNTFNILALQEVNKSMLIDILEIEKKYSNMHFIKNKSPKNTSGVLIIKKI